MPRKSDFDGIIEGFVKIEHTLSRRSKASHYNLYLKKHMDLKTSNSILGFGFKSSGSSIEWLKFCNVMKTRFHVL